MADINKVAVVGGGTMGNGIAHVFAQYGYEVTLIDVSDERLDGAKRTISGNLERQVKKGTLDAAARDATLSRLRTATKRADAAGAQLVIEAVPEKLELKREVLQELDAAAPDAIMASNTSSISITALAAMISHPERMIGMHFMNPVPVMKLVEVIRGLQTSQETLATVLALAQK